MIDRAHLVRERLYPENPAKCPWSFSIEWLGGIKQWVVHIWNPVTQRRLIRIEIAHKDLDQACKEALEEAHRAENDPGWAGVAKALQEEDAPPETT